MLNSPRKRDEKTEEEEREKNNPIQFSLHARNIWEGYPKKKMRKGSLATKCDVDDEST